MAGEMAERIGARIRARRLELGLNQRELAELMPPAVSGQHISNWERGVNRPGDRNIELLAQALEVDVAYFYAPEQEEPEEAPNLMGVLNGGEQPQLDRIEQTLTQVLERLAALEPLQDRLEHLDEDARRVWGELATSDAEVLSRIAALEKTIRDQSQPGPQ